MSTVRLVVLLIAVAIGAHAQCPGADSWARAVANSRVTFNAFHPSGVKDSAFASIQARAAAAGQMAQNSNYQNAPGGSVCLVSKMADALLQIAATGSVGVNEISGGSHSVGSAHYQGRCIDIGSYNGQALTASNKAGAMVVIEACRRLGADKIFNINLPCGQTCLDHKSWVHCQWPASAMPAPAKPNDAACAARSGVCKEVPACTSGKTQSGLCPSFGASVKCCLA